MKSLTAIIRRFDELWHRSRANAGFPWIGSGIGPSRSKGASADTAWTVLPSKHFGHCPDHINASSMTDAVNLLGGRPATILETGSSAWGTNSTVLWDSYAQATGGRVWTVDIRRGPSRTLLPIVTPRTTLVCDDSVSFLKRWSLENRDTHVDLVYLDSWDVSFREPMPAAVHCLHEFLAIEPHLRKGSLLLIDDTPGSKEWLVPETKQDAINFHANYGVFPGKGMLVDLLLDPRPGVRKVHHRYQTLYEFTE